MSTAQTTSTETVSATVIGFPKNSLALTKYDLMTAWANGILNDQAYIYLALKMTQPDITKTFNTDVFIEYWAAPKHDSDKMKTLSSATVLGVLAKLAAKDSIELSSQLSIGFIE
jgi:hypothetical protein